MNATHGGRRETTVSDRSGGQETAVQAVEVARLELRQRNQLNGTSFARFRIVLKLLSGFEKRPQISRKFEGQIFSLHH